MQDDAAVACLGESNALYPAIIESTPMLTEQEFVQLLSSIRGPTNVWYSNTLGSKKTSASAKHDIHAV